MAFIKPFKLLCNNDGRKMIGMIIVCVMRFSQIGAVGRIEDEPASSIHEVEAVLGSVAKLPCDIDPAVAGDEMHIVIWFKETAERKAPIYSFDARGKSLKEGRHWTDNKILGQRAQFRYQDRPAILLLDAVRDDDGGAYYCRVDFSHTPTRNVKVNLTVIVPTEKLSILDENGKHIKNYMLGPYNEGSSVNITCVATGGRPLPKVTWWLENALLDDSMDYLQGRRVRNVLHLDKLQRKHLNSTFICSATNNHLVVPISSPITLDINLRPLSIRLRGPNKPLSADQTYELECEVIGSRPEPTITWWKGSVQMKNTRETTSPDGNMTASVLTFVPTIEDGGKYLSCRGEQSQIPDSGIEDGWKLDIYHVPIVTLELGNRLNASAIQEGLDVYFECNIKSNPWVYKISWRHNGKQLYNNIAAGTIVTNQSLVLQSITTSRTGHYTCVGHNQEGDGESNSLLLDVKFSPVCRPGQSKVFGVARHETVKITCELEANPTDVEFTWKFNNTADTFDIPSSQIYVEKARSVAGFKPITEQDYGTLLCMGKNQIGVQKEPCVFYITPAGKPDALSNCSISNETADSLYIECSEGFDGGIQQIFVMEVYNTLTSKLVSNITSRAPIFTATGLESGAEFSVSVYAANKKGRSRVTQLSALTLKGAEKHTAEKSILTRPLPPENCSIIEKSTYQIRLKCHVIDKYRLKSSNIYLVQVYDASTRHLIGTSTSQNPDDITITNLPLDYSDVFVFVRTIDEQSMTSGACIVYVPTSDMFRGRATTPVLLHITPLLGAVIGVVAALILVAVVIVIVIRLRSGNDGEDKDYDDGGLSSSGRRCVAGNNSDKASTEPLNKDMNDSVDSLEEKNPDIIPQNNADDEYQDEERAFERLNNAPSVRVYTRMQSPNPQAKNGNYVKTTTPEITYAELSLTNQQMTPHVVYNQHPPSIAINVMRRPEPTVYAQLDMKRMAHPVMPHPGGFQTLRHPHLPTFMTRPIRDDHMLQNLAINSETPLLGPNSNLPPLKEVNPRNTPPVSSTLPRPVTATRF